MVGQYVLSKFNDARERSQLDKIAKEKYDRLSHLWLDHANAQPVSEGDSSRTRSTAP